MNGSSDKSSFTARTSQLIAIALILGSYPLSLILPPWWAWENRPIEDAQAVILVLGMIHAIVLFRRSVDRSKWLWAASIPLWFLLAVRELSFGAVFLPSPSMGDDGPRYPTKALFYHNEITPFVIMLILLSFAIIVFKRVAPLGIALLRERKVPWLSLSIVVVAMAISTAAEGHLGITIPLPPPPRETIEELTELAAYLVLWTAQFEIFAAFRSGLRVR